MKEVDKKDAPAVSGGYVGPLVTDPPIVPVIPDIDYPQNPQSEFDDPTLPR